MRLNAETGERDQDHPDQENPPDRPGEAARTILDRSFCFQRDPEGSVHGERQQGGNRNQERVPIQNAGFLAGGEIGPQWQEEFAGPVERNTPNYITEGSAKEDREQRAGTRENCVPKRLPDETL